MSTAKSIEHSTHSCENHLVSYIRIASQEGQEIDREHMNNICLNICMYSCTFYKCIAKSPSVEERLIRCKGPAAQYANQVAPVPLVHVLVQTSTSTIYSITILVQICQLSCTSPIRSISISMPTRLQRSPTSIRDVLIYRLFIFYVVRKPLFMSILSKLYANLL